MLSLSNSKRGDKEKIISWLKILSMKKNKFQIVSGYLVKFSKVLRCMHIIVECTFLENIFCNSFAEEHAAYHCTHYKS